MCNQQPSLVKPLCVSSPPCHCLSLGPHPPLLALLIKLDGHPQHTLSLLFYAPLPWVQTDEKILSRFLRLRLVPYLPFQQFLTVLVMCHMIPLNLPACFSCSCLYSHCFPSLGKCTTPHPYLTHPRWTIPKPVLFHEGFLVSPFPPSLPTSILSVELHFLRNLLTVHLYLSYATYVYLYYIYVLTVFYYPHCKF